MKSDIEHFSTLQLSTDGNVTTNSGLAAMSPEAVKFPALWTAPTRLRSHPSQQWKHWLAENLLPDHNQELKRLGGLHIKNVYLVPKPRRYFLKESLCCQHHCVDGDFAYIRSQHVPPELIHPRSSDLLGRTPPLSCTRHCSFPYRHFPSRGKKAYLPDKGISPK